MLVMPYERLCPGGVNYREGVKLGLAVVMKIAVSGVATR